MSMVTSITPTSNSFIITFRYMQFESLLFRKVYQKLTICQRISRSIYYISYQTCNLAYDHKTRNTFT